MGPVCPLAREAGTGSGSESLRPAAWAGAAQRVVGERVAWGPERPRGGRREAVDSRGASLGSPRLRAAIGKPRAAERDS